MFNLNESQDTKELDPVFEVFPLLSCSTGCKHSVVEDVNGTTVTVCYIKITELRMLWLTNQNQTFNRHVMKQANAYL